MVLHKEVGSPIYFLNEQDTLKCGKLQGSFMRYGRKKYIVEINSKFIFVDYASVRTKEGANLIS